MRSITLANERFLLAPLGTGRLTRTGSDIRWNGVLVDMQATTLTAAHFLRSILPDVRAELAQGFDPENRDPALRNLNRRKEGANLYDPSYLPPSAFHVMLGVQRAHCASSAINSWSAPTLCRSDFDTPSSTASITTATSARAAP